MATWLGASVSGNGHKSCCCCSSYYLPDPLMRHGQFVNPDKIAFSRLSHKPKLSSSFFSCKGGWNCSSPVVKAQLNEVIRFPPFISFSNLQTFIQTLFEPYLKDQSSTSTSIKSEEATGDVNLSNTLTSEESLSQFITQVKNLVKLVDSNDIVELQLKQLDWQLHIRKNQALPPPPSAPIHSQPQPPVSPTSPVLAPSPVVPKAQPPNSSHPPLKSPTAGTFYTSPAPGEPAFVKVGDKVQKGQVLCIIEAMKLMNEIEADQSGTLAEIIAEDGKPVSVDTPLFVNCAIELMKAPRDSGVSYGCWEMPT